MKFWYEWDEPELAKACRQLEERQIYEQSWRETRRNASLTIALAIPLLVALLTVSFEYLSRRQVSGDWGVIVVCLTGGLLGGVIVGLRRLSALTRTRLMPECWPAGAPFLVLTALLAGAGAGLASAFVLLSNAGHDSYRPQTVYLIALAAAIWLSRFLPIRTVVSSSFDRQEQ
jgi:hypothetical protein